MTIQTDNRAWAAPSGPARDPAYAMVDLLGMPVVYGHCVHATPGGYRCSCGRPGCPEPGAHLRQPDEPALRVCPSAPSTGSCSVLLPLGERVDAIDVALRAGEVALGYLRLWAVPTSPVVEHRGRLVFLVGAHEREDIAGLDVRGRLGDPRRGIRYRSSGYQVLPPSNRGTPAQARWAVEPTRSRRERTLPTAAELLGALAYAVHHLQRAEGRPVAV
jgi:hypothetical protein